MAVKKEPKEKKEKKPEGAVLRIGAHDVVISNPDKVYFPDAGITKLQLANYYVSVGPAVVNAVQRRPMILKRHIQGITGQAFFQKRVGKHPEFLQTATFHYRSGSSAEEAVVVDVAGIVWLVNLGCIDLHVHPVRADDLEKPDELRIDLDPTSSMGFSHVIATAQVVKSVLDDMGLVGWPKTSGSRGLHIFVRIAREHSFDVVRKAGLALAREVERRAPGLATSMWHKTERHGVLVDYNQNAKDRTTCSAWSVRPVKDARVSMPLTWAQLATCDPAAFTLFTVPALYAAHGDPHADIDKHVGSLEKLLALAATQEEPKKEKKTKEQKAEEKERRKQEQKLVLVISQAKLKEDALAGLEKWKQKHPLAAAALLPDDVIVDAMRGASSAWWRVRVHLRNVPEAQRPAQEAVDPDYDWKTHEIPAVAKEWMRKKLEEEALAAQHQGVVDDEGESER